MFKLATQAQLDGLPGAVLISRLALTKSSGSLTLRTQATRRLYFQRGRVVYAGSSVATESSPAILKSQGAIDAEQYRQVLAEARQSRQALEVVTSRLGFVLGGALRSAVEHSAKLICRQMSIVHQGEYQISAQALPAKGAPLVELDPLPEMSIAVVSALPAQVLRQWLESWDEDLVLREGVFDRVHLFVRSLGLKGMERPQDVISPTSLPNDEKSQRCLALFVLLGALVPPTQDLSFTTPAKVESAPVQSTLSPEAEKIVADIRVELERCKDANHFEVLGLAEDAKSEAVNAAYLEFAGRWHQDRFAKYKLADAMIDLNKILARGNEAKEVLTEPNSREAYRSFLERQRQGLPTDVEVILKAEDLYRRAELMFDRGNIAGAFPLLEEAAQLNPGEADFWVALGYARFMSQGEEVAQQAIEEINKGIEIQPKVSKRAWLYLGQIYRAREQYPEAERYINKVLERDAKNKTANSELRHIRMRRRKAQDAKKNSGSGGLLNSLLGRFTK